MLSLDGQKRCCFGTLLLWKDNECIGMISGTYTGGRLQFQSFKDKEIVVYTLQLYPESEFNIGVRDILFQLKEMKIIDETNYEEESFRVDYDYELYKKEIAEKNKVDEFINEINK